MLVMGVDKSEFVGMMKNMETSMSYHYDRRGLKYAVEYETDNDFVVLSASPDISVSFDIYTHGLSVKETQNYSYKLYFKISDESIFLQSISGNFRIPFFHKKLPVVCGAAAVRFGDLKGSYIYRISLPINYTGTLRMGKDFDHRYYPSDDKSRRVPFEEKCYKTIFDCLYENGRKVGETAVKTIEE